MVEVVAGSSPTCTLFEAAAGLTKNRPTPHSNWAGLSHLLDTRVVYGNICSHVILRAHESIL